MHNDQSYDFGYSRMWTHGHLIPTSLFAASAGVVWLVGLPVWIWAPLAFLASWAFAGFLVARFVLRVNEPLRMPPAGFLASGAGDVVDLGCGSGRTSIMVALDRPVTRVTAVDNFSAAYIQGHGRDKTARNFEVAGVAERMSIEEGDLRDLPFEDDKFDAAVSSFAIDHLRPDDKTPALSEVHRVLRPGGEFLLMVFVPNFWMTVAFSPLFLLAFGSRADWRRRLEAAGFSAESEGSSRGGAWFLCKKVASETEVGGTVAAQVQTANAR